MSSISLNRRHLLGAGTFAAALATQTSSLAQSARSSISGEGAAPFLWGAATAGHQVEGNNVASDIWLLEQVKPTLFSEPSGDACDSFERWREDIEIVRSLNLNTIASPSNGRGSSLPKARFRCPPWSTTDAWSSPAARLDWPPS